MNLAEYSQLDGVALAELVRQREALPSELAELALAAMQTLNPSLNAVIETYPERVEMQFSDGGSSAALAGVPMLLKDTGATDKGKAQACGSRIGRGYIATADTYLTERYKRAGLNILGRTTLPEFAQAATTESALTGATRNPWDPRRSTGGSSGGAAAAVASGMVPIAHGTDTGGSIRIPAACCGLVGLKPSRGRISSGPALDDTLYGGLNTEHIICRSVRDTATVLQISCNSPGIGDAYPIANPAMPYSMQPGQSVAPLRIALTCATQSGLPVDPCMVEATNRVARQLGELGHHIEEVKLPIDNELEAYARADSVVWAYSTAREVQRLALATGNPIDDRHLERPTLEAIAFSRTLQLDDWFESMATYNRLRRTIGAFFTGYDLLLTPTVSTLAPKLGTLNSNRDISFDDFMEKTANFCPHTAIFNVTGQPAISLPLCTSEEGLPIGMQLVASLGDEATLLRVAAQLEEAMPWQQRRPQIHAAMS
ncbi:amidase [Luminiphilus sp.]|nr:amidase [Luminiphilus sp.]